MSDDQKVGAATEAADHVATTEEDEEAPRPSPEMPEAGGAVAEEEGDTEAPQAAQRSVPGPPAIVPPLMEGEVELRGLPEDLSDLSEEDFAKAVEQTVVEFRERDIVKGVVVKIDPDEVLVDVGYKSEGVIPLSELSVRQGVSPDELVAVGEEIEALVLDKEDEEGRLILSKKRAQYERAWGRIERVVEEDGTVEGEVIEVVKGGLIVDIGLRGFLPASLVDLRRVRDLHPFVGQKIEAKVIELDRNRNNVVLSRRAFLEEQQAEQRQAFLDSLQEGEVRTGVVSSVVNFGAFVDLGGMDGLVHVSELSWQHVEHPSEMVSVGDEVTVKVLEVDKERERISLSMKQTQEDPWEKFSRDHEEGQVVEGEVTKTVPFGAFVAVDEGVEGLVHVSEIAVHHVESPELELSVGQKVQVKITEIDDDRRRLSLSIKQASPDWQEQRPAPRRREPREFQREEEEEPRRPAFTADDDLEAILQELKEKGIGRR